MEGKLIYKKVDEIVPYENNPRHNDGAVDAVAASITEFGFKVPIIIDQNNIIVTGHTRLKAALKLGMAEVPCIVADDLTEEQVKAFRLADNKVSELAKWDFDMLNMELEELEELGNIDMSAFGFIELADIDVDGFFEEAEPKEPKEEEEREVQCPHCNMFFKVS